MTTTLRDGTEVLDPRLDYLPETDPRSQANYPVRELLKGPKPRRGRSWRAGHVLDQGSEGACVGFSILTEAAANPVPHRASRAELERIALEVYWRGQELDEWEETRRGGAGGTSILAGAKAGVEAGLFDEYRWAPDGPAGIDDLIEAVPRLESDDTAFGPAVIGVEWLDGMYATDERGNVAVEGRWVGRHAITVRGVILAPPKPRDDPLVRWRNTWGAGYGVGGDGLIRASALEGILFQAMFPVIRRRP